MQLLTQPSETSSVPCVATIGFFDGVHEGHRSLLKQVTDEADARGLSATVITFSTHPRKVMHPEIELQFLTTIEEKVNLIAQNGINNCVLLAFTHELSRLSAFDFMRMLHDRYGVVCLVIGYDHRFGHNRSEGFDDYCRYGIELGIDVVLAKPYIMEGVDIGSSLIRSCLQKGDVKTASAYLGYFYTLTGEVIEGHRVGRTLGFPTANISLSDTDKMVPQDGVYAVKVATCRKICGGMLNIGHRPTLNNGDDRSIEVHIFDFNEQIYGEKVQLSLIQFIRPEMKFKDTSALCKQLESDAFQVKAILENYL